MVIPTAFSRVMEALRWPSWRDLGIVLVGLGAFAIARWIGLYGHRDDLDFFADQSAPRLVDQGRSPGAVGPGATARVRLSGAATAPPHRSGAPLDGGHLVDGELGLVCVVLRLAIATATGPSQIPRQPLFCALPEPLLGGDGHAGVLGHRVSLGDHLVPLGHLAGATPHPPLAPPTAAAQPLRGATSHRQRRLQRQGVGPVFSSRQTLRNLAGLVHPGLQAIVIVGAHGKVVGKTGHRGVVDRPPDRIPRIGPCAIVVNRLSRGGLLVDEVDTPSQYGQEGLEIRLPLGQQIWALLNKGMNLCWDRHLPKLEVVQ